MLNQHLRFHFPKSQKITSKKEIAMLFGATKTFKKYPLILKYVWSSADQPNAPKVLISVPKRKFKRAVDRNKLKRLIREAYRLNKHKIIGESTRDGAELLILILYSGSEMLGYQKIEDSIKIALENLKNNLEEK